MPLVRQAAYARHRGISREAVRQRTIPAGGPIPVHGPKKLIDVAEADALWEATMSPQGAATAGRAGNGHAAGGASSVTGSDLARARAAALVVDIQAKRLTLEQRRGALISRERATHQAFVFGRLLRDACLTWPARIAPQLAAQFDVDAGQMTVALEDHVRHLLDELASERCEF
jgi:hypothetical protein